MQSLNSTDGDDKTSLSTDPNDNSLKFKSDKHTRGGSAGNISIGSLDGAESEKQYELFAIDMSGAVDEITVQKQLMHQM